MKQENNVLDLLPPSNLRANYAADPLGIDDPAPLLSWWVSDDRRGARQTAYHIRVGTSPEAGDLWDTGQVAASANSHIAYAGEALCAGQRAFWQVRTWDQNDQPSPWSSTASWEMGLLKQSQWKGRWITLDEENHAIPGPAILLRKSFAVASGLVRARLYVSARGVYVPFVNGQRLGEDRLTPGWTDYSIRIRYQTYDVTPFLRGGANALGAMLSDGWYAGDITWQNRNRVYGDRPWLLAQLLLEFEDGTRRLIVTDDTWKATSDGPITQASFLHGDTIDNRKDIPGWAEGRFDDAGWEGVRSEALGQVKLVAQAGPTVRRVDILPTKQHWRLDNGDWVFDLGQNMVGVAQLKVRGTAGQMIRLQHGEMLKGQSDRSVYTANLRSARCIDTVILRGDGEEVLEPPFTLHGFRYVQVSGLSGEVPAGTISGMVYHSAMPSTGRFECSHPKLNQLHHNIVWGQKGNFVEVPTDCPQRDERLGWMGDAQVFCRTACFNMDMAGFFNRWMIDVIDAQLPSGALPDVVPDLLSGQKEDVWGSGAPAWGDAGVIIPWTIYQCYGDRRILERCYETMSRYIDYLVRRCPDYVHPDFGYGDWLAIGASTCKQLIGTAYCAYSVSLMSRIAGVLGREADVKRFGQIFGRFKAAFNREFVTPAGRLVSQSQTACLLALHFGLLDEPVRSAVTTWLCADIEQRGVITTGFVGCNLILPTLSQIGRDDLAWRLLANEKFPSWLFSVNQGATTIWERWDGWTPEKGFHDAGMNSFNHYAYGSCGQWIYARIGAIDIAESAPGYSRFIVRPVIVDGLSYAKASLHSMHGTIETHWTSQDGELTLRLRIPANTSADVILPGEIISSDIGAKPSVHRCNGRNKLQLPAGRYVICCRIDESNTSETGADPNKRARSRRIARKLVSSKQPV